MDGNYENIFIMDGTGIAPPFQSLENYVNVSNHVLLSIKWFINFSLSIGISLGKHFYSPSLRGSLRIQTCQLSQRSIEVQSILHVSKRRGYVSDLLGSIYFDSLCQLYDWNKKTCLPSYVA